jgi:RimJ/RimL family protein N-acetyltransferase
MSVPELQTQHLRLRAWQADDLDPLAAIMADPETARYLDDAPLTRDETAELIDEFTAEWERFGFGRWAVEEIATGALIGQCGFRRYDRNTADFRLIIARERRDRGLGTEAARRALRYGFDDFEFRKVIAVVHPANRRAQHLLEKLGMTHTEDSVRAQGVRMLVFSLTELERRMRGH